MKGILLNIIRYFGYDLIKTGQRLSNSIALYKVGNRKWWLLPNDSISYDILNQKFEKETMSCISTMGTPEGYTIDIGANIGYASIYAAVGKVIAFEPQAKLFNLLKSNIRVNNADHIIPYNFAISNYNGTATFEVPNNTRGSVGSFGLSLTKTTGEQVVVTTLDTILPNILQPEDKISLIKIDTEGSDLFVLQGAKETIKKHKPAIIFEFYQMHGDRMKYDFGDIISLLNDLGYRITRVYDLWNYLALPNT